MKAWRVNVWFSSMTHPERVMVETRDFRFWLSAKIFANSRDLWDNWRQTRLEIIRIGGTK